jgi:hypothetical protein
MVDRILERLDEFYKRYQEEMSSTCTDIAIFKEDAVMKAYEREFPNAKPSRLSSRPLSKEFLKGREAGNYVHLSSNLRQVQNGG